MSQFDAFVAFRDFIKQICELHKTDHVVNNYNILLSKIDETKTKALDVQHKSLTMFLEANKHVLLIQPLALNDYTIKWNPLKASGAKGLNVDLMPAFTKASEKQGIILHCHLLKMAYMVFEDESYQDMLQDLKSNVPDFEDYEKGIVKKLFQSVREIDVNKFSKDEPEKFVDSIMQSKMSQILPMLRRPNIKWKKLFEHMFVEIESIGKEHGVSDPVVDDLLKSLKESDYEMTTMLPKLFGVVRHLNLTKYMGNYSAEEQTMLKFHLDQHAVDGDTVDQSEAIADQVQQLKLE